MSPSEHPNELDHGEILMRLIATHCPQCGKITDAKHAETIQDLEIVGSFIQEKKQLGEPLSMLLYGQSDDLLGWCNCVESMPSSSTG